MDRYQRALLDRVTIEGRDASGRKLHAAARDGDAGATHAAAACALSGDAIELRQSGDINETRYTLTLSGYPLESVRAVKGGEKTPVEGRRLSCEEASEDVPPRMSAREAFPVDIDFDDKTDALELSFIRGLADDLTLPIRYVDADRDRYYEEERKAAERAYAEKADVRHSTGASLVNITFRPCCGDYAYTVVRLFSGGAEPRGLRALFSGKKDTDAADDAAGWTEIKSFRLEGDDTFLAVDSLADGRYAYTLTQYDSKGDPLFATERVRFDISSRRGGIVFNLGR